MRVVSLLPSASEIVCALGLHDNLVGVSHECDFPHDLTELPGLTSAKVRTDSASMTIHGDIEDLLRKGLSVYEVDAVRLAGLAPDVIVTQTQCEVCAVSAGELDRALADWVGSRPKIVSLGAVTLEGVWDDIRAVGRAVGRERKAADVVAVLQDRVRGLAREAAGTGQRPRMAVIEWLDPLMSGGNWMPELVALAGCESVLAQAGEHSGWITMDQLKRADPDVILVIPCGFTIEKSRNELVVIAEDAEWRDLRAVKGGEVFLADGSQYFNRPGPRLVESLEILCDIAHGSGRDQTATGMRWERWG